MEIEVCAVCGEPLFKEIPMFGQTKLLRRACACRRAELEEEEKEAERSRSVHRAKDILELGYLDRGYANYTFASTEDKTSSEYKDFVQYANNWDKAKEVNRGIYLYGNAGAGKTFYASCIANEVRKRYGDYVLIGSSTELIDYMTRNYGRNDEGKEQLRRYPLVVIDDIGVERATDSSLAVMNEIIDIRYMSRKPLICTSNFPLEKLYNGTGIYGDRITSRLKEMCVQYKIVGKDRRQNG